jgi:hypothetical protein
MNMIIFAKRGSSGWLRYCIGLNMLDFASTNLLGSKKPEIVRPRPTTQPNQKIISLNHIDVEFGRLHYLWQILNAINLNLLHGIVDNYYKAHITLSEAAMGCL